MANAANEMGVFERVIERGSFAAAAQDVGLSPSAVSKLIIAIGATPRCAADQPHDTAAGAYRGRYDLSQALAGDPCGHRGGRIGDRFRAHVTARPPASARAASHDRRSFWSGADRSFWLRYPRITIDFLVTNRTIDLVAENVDIAMRTGKLADFSLIACKIVDLTQIICASPEYLARHGRPLVPSDLAQHRCLILNGIPEPTTWRFHGDNGRVAVEVRGAVSADSSDVLLRLAMEGVGIVRLGELAVARALRMDRWSHCLLDVQVSEGYPLWALLPPGRQRSPKVKVFLEFLNERLGLAPWRTTGRG